MSEATITEPATANPATAAIPTGGGAPGMDSAPASALPLNGTPASKSPAGKSPLNGSPPNESAAPPEIYAVKMTVEEWKEQQDMMQEYIPAITRDRKKAEELRQKIIFPSFILKATKLLMGADHIREEGLNTVDADLVYGPGWLDKDDGGPISAFAKANRHKWGME